MLLASAALTCGCGEAASFVNKTLPARGDLVADRDVIVQGVSGPHLEVSPPAAQRENEVLIVSGVVTRKPGDAGGPRLGTYRADGRALE